MRRDTHKTAFLIGYVQAYAPCAKLTFYKKPNLILKCYQKTVCRRAKIGWHGGER